MLEPQETIAEVKKYLKKLESIIENQASFTFITTKLINKSILDDVLCCIEASLPNEYKIYSKRKSERAVKSYAMLKILHATIKRRFLLSSSYYLVKYKEAIEIIEKLPKVLRDDINRIYNNSTNMF